MGEAADTDTVMVLGGPEDLPRLRKRVRAIAARLGLPVLHTARLVLAASQTGGEAVRGGRTPRAAVRVLRHHGETTLAVEFHATRGSGALPVPRVQPPVTADRYTSPAVRLRLPARAPAPPAGEAGEAGPECLDEDDTPALERELLAALDAADHHAEQVHRLNDELDETNRGVVALYVELEERDEQLRRAHREVFRELENALRPPPPDVAGIELGLAYLPAQEDAPTGGDLYDWLVLPSGELHVTVVDVLGHGVAGTRDALSVTHTVRTLSLDGHPFPRLIEHAAAILRTYNPDLMATVLLARLDPATGRLRLASGSHPPPLTMNTEGAQYVEVRGRGMGYPYPGSDFVTAVDLRPGDLALLYTDGLVESTRNIIEGMDRLRGIADAAARLRTAEVPEAAVQRMLAGGAHTDDTLAISLRWTPP